MPKILLIEDDELFRKMLRTTLEEMGHAVAEARDGKKGVALYEREATDVVITDLIMPEKEGIETIVELRRKSPGVKIIAMSGGGRVTPNDYLEIARKMGAKRVLSKPFSNEALAAAINEVLAEG